ncbi:MAG: magnesium transporter [Anaerolineales bacterium]|nr:magnesium transporter [Anaerolineales bacterium]
MAYVRELIGRPVADVSGRQIGTLSDLIATTQNRIAHPRIVAMAVRSNGNPMMIPVSAATVLIAPAIPLKHRVKDLPVYRPAKDDLFLARDVLDKRIIDINGVRAVRVKDLELTRVDNDIYVANVTVCGEGRGGWLRNLLRRRTDDPAAGAISWENVEMLPGSNPMRLKVSGDKLSDLHPADLADIVRDLNREESGRGLLDQMVVEKLADVLEETDPEVQADLIEHMPDEKVADVLEEMAPDEAADLLAELPRGRSEDLLELMEHEEAEDVRKLLAYPLDSAGGLMNTEFLAVPPALTAAEAMAVLRREGPKIQNLFYIYVTDESGRLRGVFSLRDLVLADPGTAVTEFMHARVFTVRPEDSQDDAAHAISKYNLLAVPVVDEENRLQGIITADDALDKIIPTAWKKRMPRLHR